MRATSSTGRRTVVVGVPVGAATGELYQLSGARRSHVRGAIGKSFEDVSDCSEGGVGGGSGRETVRETVWNRERALVFSVEVGILQGFFLGVACVWVW
jgi:hypothetical protein